jgi:hypothetical protein
VTISFTTAQLNDVLQTLTAIDLGGGHVTGAGYNSTTPLDQQLKNLPIPLAADPTAADFYTAIRGAHVEVTGSGATITGRILNIELRTAAAPKGDEDSSGPIQKHFLTVISDAGAVRSVELTSSTSVRLLDPALHSDVNRYLQVLAASRADGLRHLTLSDIGAGPRELRVSYISEVPIWKSTYRILFDRKPTAPNATETATLQGWAVVDNTVGTDWENVQLSLVAGAPQSFIQQISQPFYARRPEIGLPQEAQLTPQTHESGQAADALTGGPLLQTQSSTASLPINGRNINGHAIGQGVGAGLAGGTFRLPNAAAPVSYEDSAAASIAPNATTKAFDDFFEYKLTDPITLKRNESTLVPILQTKIPVDHVTLWSPSQPTPLRALWIINDSKLTLDRGSFAIIEEGNFGGQGLLDPIHPGERRLLSYAADQAVHIREEHIPNNTRRLQKIAVSKGILTESTVEIAEREYNVNNSASESRNVVIEHPRYAGWSLDSDPAPTETTATLYRFRIVAAPAQAIRLHVGERHTLFTHYQLASMNEDQLDLLIRTTGNISPKAQSDLLEKLAPVLEARRTLSKIDRNIADRDHEIETITTDQKRLRDNLTALKSTPEERDLTRRYTSALNSQEDRLGTLHKEIDALQQQRKGAEANLENLVQNIQMDQTL